MIIGRIPSMLQGMTQQDSKLRLPTQGDLLVNGLPSAVYGLGKRNGTDHAALLSNRSTPKCLAHAIVRGDERYVLYFDGQDLVVYGLDGHKYHVESTISSMQYLACTDLRRDLRALTLADTTVLLNRSKAVQMLPDLSPALTNVAIVYVRQGNYGQTYTVKLNSINYTFTASATLVAETDTSFIASKLADGSHVGGATGFTVTYRGGDSVLTIRANSGGDFDIEVQDSAAGALLSVCKHKAAVFSDLPPLAPQDYVTKVYGSLEENTDDYWVQFDGDRVNGANRPLAARRGSWVEAIAPSIPYRLDATTMPQELVRLQDDEVGTITGSAYATYFSLQPIEWEDRTVGDLESSKDPSFVGHAIGSLFLYKNRLGFLSRGQVILSRAGDLFNYWRSATIHVIDDDPIDIDIPTGKAIDFDHAIPFSEELLLLGPRAQMTLSAQDSLTPLTVRSNPATELEIDTGVIPATVDSTVFIPTWTGVYAGVIDYYASGVNRLKQSTDAAAQIPRLMLGQTTHMNASPLYKILGMTTEGLPNYLFTYKWMDNDTTRIQSAWGFWTFEDPILWFEFIGQDLWMIIDRPDGPCLERLRLDPNRRPDGALRGVLLDRLVSAGPVGDIGTGPSSSGTDTSNGLDLVVVGGGGGVLGTGGSSGPGDVPIDFPDIPGGPSGGGTGGDGSHPSSPGDPNPSTDADPSVSVTYDPTDDCSTLTVPWLVNSRTQVVRGSDMRLLLGEQTGDYTICVPGNMVGTRLFIGNFYTFRYRFSPAEMAPTTTYSGQIRVPMIGRLNISRWAVEFSNAGPFDFEVFRDGVFAKRKTIAQRRLGEALNNSPRSGHDDVLVLRTAEFARVDLVNPYPVQAWFTSSRWEGTFSPRGQMI